MNFRIGNYEIVIGRAGTVGKYYVPHPQGRDKALENERYAYVIAKTLREGPKSNHEVDKVLIETNQHVGRRGAIDIRKNMERLGVIEHYKDIENKKYMVKLRTS